MISRDTRLSRMPLWFIDTPSETEMVVNGTGTAPPAATPSRAASAWGPSDIEQGVFSPCVLTMPTCGLPRSSSSSPVARRKARCGVRSRPSMAMRERLLPLVPMGREPRAWTHTRHPELHPSSRKPKRSGGYPGPAAGGAELRPAIKGVPPRTEGDERQQPAGDGEVLLEVQHLVAVCKVRMEHQCRGDAKDR